MSNLARRLARELNRAGRCSGASGFLPCFGLALTLAGCVQTHWQSATGPSQTLATADQMMDVEEVDRVRRFERLARLNGVIPPKIEQLDVPATAVPGASRSIPVIRVVFDERVFFDSGSAVPRPDAAAALHLIADNMRHDVPDLRITVLGHTDAVGTDASNYRLSQERALDVLQRLVRDGVVPGQLGTVAIGKAQPVASNVTAGGRARNRRVEFLISPSETANLYVVQSRPVNPSFLRVAESSPTPAHGNGSSNVQFLKPKYGGPADFAEAPPDKRQIDLVTVKQLPLQGGGRAVIETGSPVSPVAFGRADETESGSSTIAAH